mgnify:CR=1 FL=1
MRIFITGIAGFLGSNIAEAAIMKGHTVFGNDNLVGGDEKNVPDQATAWTWDCTDFEMMKGMLIIAKPDVIIHTACYPHEGLSVFSPIQVCDSVSRGTNVTLAAAIDLKNQGKIPLQRFINMSSMARYGIPECDGGWAGRFEEWMKPRPKDPYGAHKYAAELSVSLLCQIHGLEWVNLIPHNIYGPRQKYNDPHRNVIAIMINRVLRGEPIVVYGDGNQTRCFSHINEIMPMIIECIDSPLVCGETFNIGPDEGEVTINELAELVQKIHLHRTGKHAEIVHTAARPSEVKHATCSSKKIRETLFRADDVALHMGVSILYDWITEQGPKDWDWGAHNLEIMSPLTPVTWLGKL